MTPRFLDGAIFDADELADFFERDRSGSRDRFLADLDRLIQDLCFLPRLFARKRGTPRGREVREGMTRKFPVVVVYEVTPIEVVIVSITHARAKRQPWRRRLPPTP